MLRFRRPARGAPTSSGPKVPKKCSPKCFWGPGWECRKKCRKTAENVLEMQKKKGRHAFFRHFFGTFSGTPKLAVVCWYGTPSLLFACNKHLPPFSDPHAVLHHICLYSEAIQESLPLRLKRATRCFTLVGPLRQATGSCAIIATGSRKRSCDRVRDLWQDSFDSLPPKRSVDVSDFLSVRGCEKGRRTSKNAKKDPKKTRNMSETFKLLSCCLQVSHRHFSTNVSSPKICTTSKFSVCRGGHTDIFELSSYESQRFKLSSLRIGGLPRSL